MLDKLKSFLSKIVWNKDFVVKKSEESLEEILDNKKEVRELQDELIFDVEDEYLDNIKRSMLKMMYRNNEIWKFILNNWDKIEWEIISIDWNYITLSWNNVLRYWDIEQIGR